MLLSLSCVCAAEDSQVDDNATLEIDDAVDAILTDSAVDTLNAEIDDAADGILTANAANYKTLNTEVNSATNELKLTKDYAYDSKKDKDFVDGIQIRKDNFVLDGQGHTIDGRNIAKVFEVDGYNITIRNINFINGHSGSGGAIHFNNISGLIENCNFTNNYATNLGGALCIVGQGIVRNCIFKDNSAQRMGGAVCSSNANKIINCTFIGNIADNGGGLSLGKNEEVLNCTFRNNSALCYYGGAIYGEPRGEVFINLIKDCIFDDNHANKHYINMNCRGGGVYLERGGKIINCSFTNNTAYSDYGGLYIKEHSSTVINCTFAYNSVGSYGGGMGSGVESTVINCHFINNRATNGGGANFGKVNLINSTFIGNSAINGAGAYISKQGIINGSVFINNSASIEGGAILFKGKNTIDMSIFTNNSAKEGGAISTYADLTVRNSVFTNNTASTVITDNVVLQNSATLITYNVTPKYLVPCNFGMLSREIAESEGSFTLTENYTFNIKNDNPYISGVIIDKDNFILDGQGHYIDGMDTARILQITASNVVLRNIIFRNAYSTENGGAVYALRNIIIENCTFIDNFAMDGGAVSVYANGDIRNSTFERNVALYYGGAIYSDIELVSTDNTFTDNNAMHGGAVYSLLKGKVTDSSFTGNFAFADGGAIYSTDGQTIACDFNKNLAINGGAIYSNNQVISDSTFEKNTASESGGAIFSQDGKIVNCRFTGNFAADGGAISSYNGEITGCSFTNSSANSTGGAIWIYKGVMTSCNFTGCSAKFKGGAICSNGGKIIGCSFNNNTVDGDGNSSGGAVYLQNGEIGSCNFTENQAKFGGAVFADFVKIYDVNFTLNYAYDSGGAISSVDSTVERGSFTNNSADNCGGAIDATDDLTVKDCQFTNNRAYVCGGAVNTGGNTYAKIIDSVFINNTAIERGGAITIENSMHSMSIFSCLFEESSAKKGGAIHAEGYMEVTDSTFERNSASEKGGAIDAQNDLSMSNASFVKNKAEYGGAINSNGDLLVEECGFTDNTGEGTTFNINLEENGLLITKYSVPTYLIPGFALLNRDIVRCNDSYMLLTTDYIFDSLTDDSSMAEKGVIISKSNIIINAQGHTINGAGISKIFSIFSGVENVTLKNFNFINGQSGEYGGALYIESDGIITGCSFTNFTAGDNGGAVYIQGAGTITDCSFENTSSKEYGGAVYIRGIGYVNYCNFTNTSAGMNGGAVYFNDEGNVKFSNFLNSKAVYGGAVYFKARGYVTYCNLTNNTAVLNGGGAYSVEKIVVDRSQFNDNSAQNGGAICVLAGTSIVDTVNFTANSAEKGGAIITYGDMDMDLCKFDENVASDGTNNIALVGDASLTFKRMTPANPGPYKAVELEITNVTDVIVGDVVRITASIRCEGKPFGKGNVYITINNRNYTKHVDEGFATIEIPDLKPGTYTGTVVYDCGANYTSPRQDVTFTVSAHNVTLTILEAHNITYEDTAKIRVMVEIDGEPAGVGNLTLKINNENYTYGVENGIVDFEVSNLGVGIYPCEIAFDAGENYTSPKETFNLKVAMENATISIDAVINCTYGGDVVIEVTIIGSKTTVHEGTAYINVNGQTYSKEITTGIARFTLSGLDAGIYTGVITFDGGLNYCTREESVTFEVKPVIVGLNVNVSDISYGDSAIITVNVTAYGKAINVGSVLLALDCGNYSVSVENGTALFIIPDLDAGNYSGAISFVGGINYLARNESVAFEVRPAAVDLNVEVSDISYGDSAIITVNVTAYGKAINVGSVLLALDCGNYSVSVENGTALFIIPDLDAGNYSGAISFVGGINYLARNESVAFEVRPAAVDLNVEVSDISYGDLAKITVNATSNGKPVNGGSVMLSLNGKNYTASVENGTATIEIANLDSGTYSGIVMYENGANYGHPAKPVSLNVSKQDATITANDNAYVINYGGEYSIILKDARGNVLSGQKVTFDLNGKSIGSATTDAKGVASVKLTVMTLKALKAGVKNLIIKLDSKNYQTSSKTVKITVKKEKTKIAAKKKTFKKSKKVKKYVIKLKNSKGKAVKKVKVTLKVKGKTYKAKTNKNGKATFKIKNLSKKGTFKAKITFKGNAYYNKVTKKVKIKIK